MPLWSSGTPSLLRSLGPNLLVMSGDSVGQSNWLPGPKYADPGKPCPGSLPAGVPGARGLSAADGVASTCCAMLNGVAWTPPRSIGTVEIPDTSPGLRRFGGCQPMGGSSPNMAHMGLISPDRPFQTVFFLATGWLSRVWARVKRSPIGVG